MKRALQALLPALVLLTAATSAEAALNPAGKEEVKTAMPIIEREYTVRVPMKSWSELKEKGVVRQRYDFSCGAASMATIMNFFYDQNVTENGIVRSVLNMKGVGSDAHKLEKSDFALSFADLADYGQTIGFRGVGVAMDIDALRKLRIPVIVYVKIRRFEHFTVFKGIQGDFVYLADPSFGNMKVKMAKFLEMFYQREDLKHPGRVLAFIPVDKEKVQPDRSFMTVPESTDYLYQYIENRIDH
ncbi:C39 family peptidase [Sulfurimonas sp. HSL1-6]|uniref:C39 family peptidase n=1 Tax=Thiomicrolovo immobilis TaxID=3131935 RepID=UPI0031F84906